VETPAGFLFGVIDGEIEDVCSWNEEGWRHKSYGAEQGRLWI
jgi:hypothetical protein